MLGAILLLIFTLAALWLGHEIWTVWELAKSNSASPGAVVIMLAAMFVYGFAALSGTGLVVRLVLLSRRRRLLREATQKATREAELDPGDS
jgi:heme exporter protein D